MKKKFLLSLIVLLFLMFASQGYSGTNLNLYYQFQNNTYKNSGHRWDVNDPDHYLELKFWSDNVKNVETFIKLSAGGSNPANNMNLSEANIKYRLTGKTDARGMELIYYYNQDRLWQPDHIINIVANGYDIQGLRSDWWMPNNFSGTLFIGDQKDDGSDDFNFYTIRHEIKKIKLKYNISYGQKRWGDNGDDYNSFFGLFTQWKIKDMFFSNEVLKSRDPGQRPSTDSLAFKSELQWLRFKSAIFGELGYKTMYWNFGKNYRNYLANDGYERTGDEQAYYNEIYYNLPQKAITFVLRNTYKEDSDNVKKSAETYSEVFIDFIHGYKFKTSYNYYIDAINDMSYPTYYIQIERDLSNMWYKFYYKIQDIGTQFKKNELSLENSINLTKKLTSFNRFTINYQPYLKRRSENVFAQLKYKIHDNAEMLLEYDSGWHGDYPSSDKVFFKMGVWF